MPSAMDFSALTVPVTKGEIAAYKAEARAKGSPSYNVAQAILGGALILVIVAAIVGSILAFNTVPAIQQLVTEGPTPSTVLSAFTLLFAVAIGALGAWVVRMVVTGGRIWEHWLRLSRFAAANGLLFSSKDPDPLYPGVIFTQGNTRNALNHVRSTEGRYFDVGNFQYVTGSGRNRTTHNWGFLAVKLDRRLPNMMLDSRANNSFFGSNLPLLYNKQQVLHLEGDFDKYFTLYCPKEYERDALYVFTPDLMALLIDAASPFDVEIVDDWLFVYASKPLVATDAAGWRALFAVIDTVGAKTVSQTVRYADERVGDRTANIVAPKGARLRTRVSILAVIGIVLLVAFQVLRFVH